MKYDFLDFCMETLGKTEESFMAKKSGGLIIALFPKKALIAADRRIFSYSQQSYTDSFQIAMFATKMLPKSAGEREVA